MIKIPKIKKKITSFLTKEEGNISKENLLKTGIIVAAFSIGAAMNAKPASSAVTCEPDCSDVGNPIDCDSCDIEGPDAGGWGHQNGLRVSGSGYGAQASHDHCLQTCHTSHGSHGSHCSGGWCD